MRVDCSKDGMAVHVEVLPEVGASPVIMDVGDELTLNLTPNEAERLSYTLKYQARVARVKMRK